MKKTVKREVAMFAIFGIITVDKQTGIGREPAVLFSLLFYALYMVWSLVGGLVYLTFQDDQTKTNTEASTK